ncbi:hypothetical protein ACER0C_021010 [Sarotherodon galilaeus]
MTTWNLKQFMRTDNLLDHVIKKLTDQKRHHGAAKLVTINFLLFGEETTNSSPPHISTSPTVVSPSVNSTVMSTTRAPPASTSNETSLPPTSPSSSSDSQASPTDTTVTATTAANKTTPEPPKCSYTVTPIESGLQINLMNSPPVNTTLMVNFNQSTQHNIQHLKPCTEYEHEVAFIHSDGNKTLCDSTGSKTKTKEMSKTDITVQSSVNGCVCYQSNWDISSLKLPPNITSVNKSSSDSNTLCVQTNDICSDYKITFTSETCVNTSFDITKNIIVDLYNLTEIQQNRSTGLPAKIDPMLPKISECKNLSVYYTCSEKDKPGQMNKLELSELDPFRNYSCTGLIFINNIPTVYTTPPVHLNTDCDLTINLKTKKDNTSIKLSCKTTSKNCDSVLHTRHNLSYNCRCSPSEKTRITELQSDGGTCDFTGLEAFTDYTCEVQPKYNGRTVSNKKEVTLKTDPGVTVTVPENNVIKVECHHRDNIRGPMEKRRFIARLYPGGENKQNKTDCKFEFKDLSYSTEYTVEVTVFNGYFESKPGRETADTRYNDKAVIGFLIFLISAALLLVACVCYRKLRKRRSDVDENVPSEAIYMNTRPPGWRHKEAQ